MKQNQIPIIIMLVAGCTTLITTFIKQFELVWSLFWTLIVMFGFYIIGVVFVSMLLSFEKSNVQKENDEGAILEKESEVEEDSEASQDADHN